MAPAAEEPTVANGCFTFSGNAVKDFGIEIQARSASEWVIATTMDSLAGASCLYFSVSPLSKAHNVAFQSSMNFKSNLYLRLKSACRSSCSKVGLVSSTSRKSSLPSV
jgi:hypothetical protein